MQDCLIQYNCLYILFPFVGNFLVTFQTARVNPEGTHGALETYRQSKIAEQYWKNLLFVDGENPVF